MERQSQLDVLEGRVEELSRHWDRVFADIGNLGAKVDAVHLALSARIGELDQKVDRRFEAFEQKVDSRFEAVDRRFEAVDRRFEAVDRRFESVDRQFVDLRVELSKQFRWTFSTMLALLGMMLTVGAGVATALLRQ
jgi:hypothetical protein